MNFNQIITLVLVTITTLINPITCKPRKNDLTIGALHSELQYLYDADSTRTDGEDSTKILDDLMKMAQYRSRLHYALSSIKNWSKMFNADKFGDNAEPWCKEGDWVIFGRYAGSRFKIEGGEVRLLNDDEIIARISNPDDILHF